MNALLLIIEKGFSDLAYKKCLSEIQYSFFIFVSAFNPRFIGSPSR